MVQEETRRRDRDVDGRSKERHRDKERGQEREKDRRDGEKDGRSRVDERSHQESRRSERDNEESAGGAASSKEIEDRIRRTREERLKKQGKEGGSKSLVDADTGDDLLGWVQKTKQLEEKRRKDEDKARAAATARRLAEAEAEDEDSDEDQYAAQHLAGLKVTHGLEKVMDGGAIVLTLKDTNILDEKGNDVNEAGDELENVEIIEQKRRDDARKAAKKGPSAYDKFENDMEGARGILPQYDDSKEQEQGVVLDDAGGLDLKSQERMEEIRRKLMGAAAADQGKQSLLAGGGQKIASDYFTAEEMERFKKPKERKKKRLRKREKLDLDAMEEEAKAAGLGTADRGSRATRNVDDVEKERRKGEAAEREAAYEHALEKAEVASRAMKDEAAGVQIEDEDEEDDELVQSLERARQAALKATPKGVEAVATRAIQLAKDEPVVKAEPETDSGLIFTSTGEFVRGISLEEPVKKEKNELFDDDEETKDAEETEPGEEDAAGGWMEVTEQGGDKEEEPEEKVETITEEVTVGSGVAGALKLLQQRGALSDSVDWGGRNMDKKKGRLLGVVDETLLGLEKQVKPGEKEEWPRDVQLIRHDRFGRVMTPKEAWRELNHHFHGMYPSKNKKEKEYKQFMEEKKLKQMVPGDTPAGSVQKMRDVQAKTASPYIVLSGSVKPGQTSDFRSGFAVAEKETQETFKPGELTPMLADQKVQKFLAGKRKERAGDMGPPPPKTSKM